MSALAIELFLMSVPVSEPFLTFLLVMVTAAYPVPPSATNSASEATTLA